MKLETARIEAERVASLKAPTHSRLLRRAFSTLAFHLYAKPCIMRTDTLMLDGFRLHVPPTVFHPKLYYTSRYLGRYVAEMALHGKKVLDVGCGSGFVSLVAASRGASVTALDINPAAVGATSENSALNGLDSQINTLQSDLFDRLPASEFDFIFVNPPFYDGTPRHIAESAWKGSGLFSRRFAATAQDYLSPSGVVIAVLSTDTDLQAVFQIFAESGYAMETLKSRRLLFETLSIVRFGRSRV